MNNAVVLQDLGIAITAKNLNPTVFTYDFLKYSDVIPSDLELVQKPIVSNQGSQVAFRNGITLVAQTDRLSFIETFAEKELGDIQVPEIAHKYVKVLPNVEYQAVGINVRAYVSSSQADGEAEVQSYVHSLLAPGSWQEIGTKPATASIQLAFSLEHSQLNFSINEGTLYLPEQQTKPIVLFSGNFSYNIEGDSKDERFNSLHQYLDRWQVDVEIFQEIIKTKFIPSEEATVINAPGMLETEELLTAAV